MKKFFCLMLAVATLICSFPFNVGAVSPVFTDTTGDEYYYTAAASLAAKGILKGYPDGSFGADKTITRAEMATIICRMIGKEEDALTKTTDTYYTDVALDHWALGYVNLATDDKIINGDGNGLFRPEDNVNYQEAIKLVLCAAGYGDNIELDENDWSLGYVNLANLAEITDGIVGKKGEALSRGDVALLVHNALKIKKSEIPEKDENTKKLAELNPDGDITAFFDEDDNLNVFVGKFYDKKVRTGSGAVKSLELVKDFVGIEAPEEELEYERDYERGDNTIYVLNQMYKGIPVYGRTVKITLDKDKYPVALNSGFLCDIDISTDTKITEDEAKDIVEAKYEGYEIVSKSVEKVIYSIDTDPFVAWAMEIQNDFDGYNLIVDAFTGEIVCEFSTLNAAKGEHKYYTTTDVSGNEIVADTTKKGDTYYLDDPIRKITTNEITKLLFEDTDVYRIDEANHKFNDKNKDGYDDFQLAATAHVNTALVYDYYADPERFDFIFTYGQNNNPKDISVIIPIYNDNYTALDKNAYSSTPNKKLVKLSFGIGTKTFTGIDGGTYNVNFVEAIDVVAHEFTHAVFKTKSPEAAKQYRGFTGSINEAYADIMGEFAEAHIIGNGIPNWIQGEKAVSGGSRDFKSPHNKKTSAYWGDNYFENPEFLLKYQNSSIKGGIYKKSDIYVNSTLISHAAYLMWDKGFDISRLEKLWFNSMDGYDASSTFLDVRLNLLATAKLMDMTDDEIKIIEEAFDEVGIVGTEKDVIFYVIENTKDYKGIADAEVTLTTDPLWTAHNKKEYKGTTDENGYINFGPLKYPLWLMFVTVTKEGYSSEVKELEIDDKCFIILDKLSDDLYLENFDLSGSQAASQMEIKETMFYAPVKKDKYVCEAPGTYYVYPKDPITDNSSKIYHKPTNIAEALSKASVGIYDMTTYECKSKPSDPNLFLVSFSRNEYAVISMDSGYCRFDTDAVYAYKVEDSTITIPKNTTVALRVCRDFTIDTSEATGLNKSTYALYDGDDTEFFGSGTFERPLIYTVGQTLKITTGDKDVSFSFPFRALSIRHDNLSNIGM